jgi:glucosamine kinase
LKKFLIIESGSTKADWAFVENEKVTIYTSQGINPTTGAGLDQVLVHEISNELANTYSIFFYGAGSNISAANAIIKNYLAQYIKPDVAITVESDTLAAARACAGNNKAIICILGTGSNSCIYDGHNITEQIVSLGYLLSDEGSGNNIGKEILKAYFYKQMNADDNRLFQNKYNLSREVLLNKLYKEDRVSAYLAEFSQFLNICTKELKISILTKVFNEFIEIRIKKYTDFINFDIYFVGSIAAAFENELKSIMKQHKLELKGVLKTPLQNLILYHKSRKD